jgi:hypothetical protein
MYEISCVAAAWRGFLPSVLHKTKMMTARTMPPPTAMPAIAPLESAEDLLVLLEAGDDDEEDALEGPGFGVVAAEAVGLGFVPVEVTVAAAPTWLT